MMKYLVTGNRGQLGREFCKYFTEKKYNYTGFDIDETDISDFEQLKSVFEAVKPGIVINTAAYNQVDLAEKDPSPAYKANKDGVKNLASLCSVHKAFLVHYGTDYVFDGKKEHGLYIENDIPNPLNNYAKSKYEGELVLSTETYKFLLLRVSWVFGMGQQNFIYKLLQWTNNNPNLKMAFDEVSVPTSTKTIVEVTMKALQENLTGLYHLTNNGYATRYEWAKFVISSLRMNNILYPVSRDYFNLPARRPGFSAMSNELIKSLLNIEIPTWEEAVKEYLRIF